MNVENFEKADPQLKGMYAEISELSKKKPNDGLNKFKLKLVNKTLCECNALLGDKYKPFADFDQFDEDELPTNSDVVFILSQYIKLMDKFKEDNVGYVAGKCYWMIDGKVSDYQTHRPNRIL